MNLRPSDSNSRRLLWVILGAGLLVRLVLLYVTRETGLMIVDEQHYHTLALNLLHGFGFAWEPGHLTSMRPPLFPAFMATVWSITGTENLIVVRMAQMMVSLATVYFVYRLGLLVFDHRVALVAAAGLAIYPSMLAFNAFLLTEVSFTFFLTLLVYSVLRLIRTEQAWLALAAGVILGLAALARSVMWLFPLVLCPFIYFALRGTVRRRLGMAAIAWMGYAAVIAPWAIRNTRLQGVFTVVDTLGGVTLRMGNYRNTPMERAWDPVTLSGHGSIGEDFDAEHLGGAFSWSEGHREKWQMWRAIEYMLENPVETMRRSAIKFARFWGLERTVIAGWQQGLYHPPLLVMLLGTIIIPPAYVAVMLLACLAVFFVPPDDRRDLVFMLLLIGFLAGMHSLTFGHERYRLPLVPLLLLFAAAAVVRRSWRDIRLPLRSSAAPLVVTAYLLVIWAKEVLILDADRIQILLRTIFG
jgi:4-amino-4-deoxy-L-arabinose transferase-like glycosyltransferase